MDSAAGLGAAFADDTSNAPATAAARPAAATGTAIRMRRL
jgi:hypothetical protein